MVGKTKIPIGIRKLLYSGLVARHTHNRLNKFITVTKMSTVLQHTSLPSPAVAAHSASQNELGVIVDFVRELSQKFGDSDEKLANYAEILSHLDWSMEDHNKVHRTKFAEFCKINQDGILSRDLKLFRATILDYKAEVFEINFGKIWLSADAENKEVVWRYLLTILAMTAEEGDTKTRAKSELASLIQTVSSRKKGQGNSGMPTSTPSPFSSTSTSTSSSSNAPINNLSQTLGGIVGTMFEKMASNPNSQKIAESQNVEEAISLMLQSGIVSDVMSAFTNPDGSPNTSNMSEIFAAMTGLAGAGGNVDLFSGVTKQNSGSDILQHAQLSAGNESIPKNDEASNTHRKKSKKNK